MSVLRRAGNVVSLNRAAATKRRASVYNAAIAAVSGDDELDEPACALVAVSIYPGGDTRQVVAMVEQEQVRAIIESLLDVVAQLEEFASAEQ